MSHPLTIPDGATAHRLQQRKRAVLRWCWAHGYVEQNVAGEGIEGALPAMPAVKAHFRALPYQEVAAALNSRWWNPGERRERGGARLTRRVAGEGIEGAAAGYTGRQGALPGAAKRRGSAGWIAGRTPRGFTGCLARMHRRSNAGWVSPQAVKTVDGSKASKAAKLCLRFLILTAARSGEARGATCRIFVYSSLT